MDEIDVSSIANVLYSNLIASSPVDTGKMKDNITMDELDDRYVITISKGVPYARFVNYNWGARSNRRRKHYKEKHLHKERDNYKWVEMTIEETIAYFKVKGSATNEL